jgi:hypothetical protein
LGGRFSGRAPPQAFNATGKHAIRKRLFLPVFLAKNRDKERPPGIGRKLECKRRAICLKMRWRRPAAQFRLALVVETLVMKPAAVFGGHRRGRAAPFA